MHNVETTTRVLLIDDDQSLAGMLRLDPVDGDRLRIEISDKGEGVEESDLPLLFEAFYRTRRSVRAPGQPGTGLGLAIVRHVAGNHGGDVSVSSVEGEGSTFVLRLPLSASDATATQSKPTSEGVA